MSAACRGWVWPGLVHQQQRRAGAGGAADAAEQVLVLLGGEVVDEVGEQEYVVAGREVAGRDIAGDHGDLAGQPDCGDPSAGQAGDGGQIFLEHYAPRWEDVTTVPAGWLAKASPVPAATTPA